MLIRHNNNLTNSRFFIFRKEHLSEVVRFLLLWVLAIKASQVAQGVPYAWRGGRRGLTDRFLTARTQVYHKVFVHTSDLKQILPALRITSGRDPMFRSEHCISQEGCFVHLLIELLLEAASQAWGTMDV